MTVNDHDQVNQLYGRMMECCDIQMAIESEQFKTLDEVLAAVKARAENLQRILHKANFFSGNRSVSYEEFELVTSQFDADLVKDKH